MPGPASPPEILYFGDWPRAMQSSIVKEIVLIRLKVLNFIAKRLIILEWSDF